MKLLARYVRHAGPPVLDLLLLDIETREPVHTILDGEAEQENEALIHLAHQWAAQNGHTVADIDSSILFAN